MEGQEGEGREGEGREKEGREGRGTEGKEEGRGIPLRMKILATALLVQLPAQTWPWVGFIRGLGWVGSEIFAYEMDWVRLGLVPRN